MIFDDHEITNDAYATGAENHEEQDDPDTSYTGPGEPAGIRAEGEFLARRARAFRAYLEWMPIREPASWQPEPHVGTQFFRRFSYGDLADLSVVETRQNRSLPRAGVVPGQVFNADQWDGYQVDQRTLLTAMRGSGTDPVVLTGDIHSSWANDLPTDYDAYRISRTSSVGVEFVCPSITSDGFKEVLGSAATAQVVTGLFQAANPWVRYLEGIGHGFAVLDVTPARVQTDFFFIRTGGDKGLLTDPRTDPQASVGYETSFASVKGSRQVSGPVAQLSPRSDQPRTASASRRDRRGRGRAAARTSGAR